MLSPDEVYGVLNTVMDPEVPVISVVELGIVRDVAIQNDAVTITITPTYSGCPAMREIEADIRTALERAQANLDALIDQDRGKMNFDTVVLGLDETTRELNEAWGLVTCTPDARDARARRVAFTHTGLVWLHAFEDAVAQTELELQQAVGEQVATVIAIGLEAYAA